MIHNLIVYNKSGKSVPVKRYEVLWTCFRILWNRIHPRTKLKTRDISNGHKTKQKLRGKTQLCAAVKLATRMCACAWIRRETFKVFPNFCPHAPLPRSIRAERVSAARICDENIGQDSFAPSSVLMIITRLITLVRS